ncbi:hypothetical protein [Noviherbaspirillum sp.]|jgi:hypothetical protein|uniref:hypothetical protein n=1 Tax=Noviherbaspirillum sp. TaxID=1926288 RepID=UPI0025E500BD|nr:hypothetical protein [Noviherbaspirillum sp.]
MTTPIEEIKIRARLLLKAIDHADAAALQRAQSVSKSRRWAIPEQWTLSLCLNSVSAEAGFDQWEHARRVLGGEARAGDDMGTLWYDKTCTVFMNHWFATYADALTALQSRESFCLFPYGRQFVVADAPFIEAIGLAQGASGLVALKRDLVAGYGGPEWQKLVMLRLRHMRQ